MNFASTLKKLAIVPVAVFVAVIVTACGGQPTAEPVQVTTTSAQPSVVSAEAYVVPTYPSK